jgi:hypothetical protein
MTRNFDPQAHLGPTDRSHNRPGMPHLISIHDDLFFCKIPDHKLLFAYVPLANPRCHTPTAELKILWGPDFHPRKNVCRTASTHIKTEFILIPKQRRPDMNEFARNKFAAQTLKSGSPIFA